MLSSLLGILLIVAIIAVGLFALNQLIFAYRTLELRMESQRQRRVERIMDELHEGIDKVREEVEPKYELWWATTGKALIEQKPELLQELGVPFDADVLPEQVRQMLQGPALQLIEDNALEFAVLLASQKVHDAAVTKMRRAEGSKAAEHMATKHSRHVEHHRKELGRIGINLDEFEELFTAA